MLNNTQNTIELSKTVVALLVNDSKSYFLARSVGFTVLLNVFRKSLKIAFFSEYWLLRKC